MSGPMVVNTTDGMCWTRREGTRGGEALYALAKCGQCPEFVMVTYSELQERGIVGSADVLPVPVGPEPQADPVAAGRSLDLLALMDERAASKVSPVLAAVLDEAERLRDRIAELEAQRAALAERLRAGQHWQRGRNPELVSEDYVSQSELREIFGIPLTAPWEDEPAPVPLSTDCASCGHTLNWHGGDGCSAGSAPARCGCRDFVAKSGGAR